uniref:Uncharacterized protein n=1 Tax=Arundo donax TaxID=35708 RepID=A0A0A8YZA7_ARUDO
MRWERSCLPQCLMFLFREGKPENY